MKRKIIFFDIDYTIYNTQAFIELKTRRYAKLFKLPYDEVKEKEFEAARQIVDLHGVFVTEDYARTLAELLDVPGEWKKIFKIAVDDRLYQDSVYPETKEVLKKLERGFHLGVFAQGDDKFQKMKLRKAKLLRFFEPELIFIFRNKTKELKKVAKKHPPFAVVDDKADIAEAWAETGAPIVVRVKRGRYAEREVSTRKPNIREVLDLRQAYEVIVSEL